MTSSGIAKLSFHGRSFFPAGFPSDRHRAVPGRKGAPTQRPVVARCHKVAAEVEEVRDGGVDENESLRLKHGLEPPHAPLSYPRSLMRQLRPVVRVLASIVRRPWQQLAAGQRVTSQLVRHDSSWLSAEAR